MSYPQFQAASDYLGAIADEDYVKALPSNSYEDRGGAVLDGNRIRIPMNLPSCGVVRFYIAERKH